MTGGQVCLILTAMTRQTDGRVRSVKYANGLITKARPEGIGLNSLPARFH
jgi:hypothetical protein